MYLYIKNPAPMKATSIDAKKQNGAKFKGSDSLTSKSTVLETLKFISSWSKGPVEGDL